MIDPVLSDLKRNRTDERKAKGKKNLKQGFSLKVPILASWLAGCLDDDDGDVR